MKALMVLAVVFAACGITAAFVDTCSREIVQQEQWVLSEATVPVLEKTIGNDALRIASLIATLNVIAALEEWHDNLVDGEYRCRVDSITRLYNDNVVLARCCARVCQPLEAVVPVPQPFKRFSPNDLLPDGANELEGIGPMFLFLHGNEPAVKPSADLAPPSVGCDQSGCPPKRKPKVVVPKIRLPDQPAEDPRWNEI